jgi:hypothetical protein
MTPENKVYVLVRKDMAKSQRSVQAIHAALGLTTRHPEVTKAWSDAPSSVIVYGVTGVQLKRIVQELPAPSAQFREPDWNMTLTAAAYYGKKIAVFEDLDLL